jgi:hypothetical protein
VIDTTFDAAAGPAGLLPALKDVQAQAAAAIAEGYSFICLSDRAFGPARVPIPMLLATGAVHHQLVAMKRRTQVGLLIETGEVSSQLGVLWEGRVELAADHFTSLGCMNACAC